jgi:polysaccharide deacetylase family protein (PEP-CTERM system associated)
MPVHSGINAKIILTSDIEDWAQSTWDRSLEITDYAWHNTQKLLDILAQRGKTATMFVLGKLAQKFPNLVKQIAAAGHEIGSHGFAHIEAFRQTPKEFKEDIQRSKNLLEDLTGQQVLGYRAPDFSILSENLWALEILAEAGYIYDSSIFPFKHSRYGISWWPTRPVSVNLPSGKSIIELPLATLTFWGKRWPVAGGGYHRLLPRFMIYRAVKRYLQQDKGFVAYCHPYDFNPEELGTLHLNIPWRTKLHQGLGRRGFRSKFEYLLESFETMHALDAVRNYQWEDYPLPKAYS